VEVAQGHYRTSQADENRHRRPADAAYAWHREVGVRIDRVGATLAILAEPALDGMPRVHIGRYGHAVLRGRPLGGDMSAE
jgi:hypothetical protein